MNRPFSRFFVSCLCSIGIISIIHPTTKAIENRNATQKSSNPIQLEASQAIYISGNLNNPDSKSQQQEYLFKAPDNKIISNPGQLTKNQGFKVEVYGTADDLLKQVKNIEPKAFRKGDIIQVGIFSHQNNAEILLRKLAVAGFWSRIVPH